MARRGWKKGEEMYMTRMYLRQPVEKTAKALNRSKSSIYNKAREMGISYEYLSMTVIANIFNIDNVTVKRWIEKLDLKSTKMPYQNGFYYFIKSEDFWKWANTHKSEINWSEYQTGSILPEPDWAKIEKQKYKNKKHYNRITNSEIIQIKSLLRKGLTYKEISDKTERSVRSIEYIAKRYIYSKK